MSVSRAAHPLLLRVAAPAFFLAGAAALLLAGDAAPHWLERMGEVAGVGAPNSLRIGAAVLATFALSTLAIGAWRRTIARVGAALVALMALASASGALNGEMLTLIGAVVAFVASAVLFSALGRAPPSRGWPTIGDSWRVMALVLIATGCFAIAAVAPLRVSSAIAMPPTAPPPGVSLAGAIDLEMNRWQGKGLEQTGLLTHLPALRESLGPGVTYLIFYSPRCGHCHELFASRFSGHVEERVIAIRVPATVDDSQLPSDQPEDINCPECVRLALPAGPLWIVTPPAVVRLENGVVTCVSEPPSTENCFVP